MAFPGDLRHTAAVLSAKRFFLAIAVLLPACTSSEETETGSDNAGGSSSYGTPTSVSSSGTNVGGGGSGGATASTGAASGGGGAGAGEPWSGPIESLQELDLGDLALGATTDVPIPEHTLGFTAIVTAPSPDEVIGIARLRNPIGSSVIFNFAILGHPNYVFGDQGWIAGSNPQTDSMDGWPVQPGTWTISIGDDDGSISGGQVSIWARRTVDGQFHGGVVDINVFIAPGVVSQAYMGQVVDTIFSGGYAGLTLGSVDYYQLDAAATVLSSRAEYRDLVASTGGIGTHPALNLFVVQDFSDAEFGQAIGVAAGIPGTPMQSGISLSGVAYQPSGDSGYDGTVLRHEVGHLTGLYHTTEFAVAETDPLDDTPQCSATTIQNNPDACPDVSNMMFPIAYGATAISTSQAIVIRGSGLYRGIISEGGSPMAPLPLPPAPTSAIAAARFAPAARITGALPAITTRRSAVTMPVAPDPLERVLGGVWCSHTHAGADYEALAIQIAGSTVKQAGGSGAGRLRAIVLDASRPDLMRARALGAYARASANRAPALALSAALAADESAGTDLRVAALRALSRWDAPRARSLAATLIGSSDNVVRAVGLRLIRP
jgi:hypothetical protein